ncbi:MAG: hypothetical protein HGJ94_09825 [Desulfosarcina sp.]|nr:hypothetical protein [Desulfosarcina sp.]MBC2743739.1 hypothetical protein [Desulfosarcina sp.]MBC2766648.1 hypothetical protein [Desulfosarcina sp.]
MGQFITNGFKLISRLDRDIGVLIDNCLGFLYSIDLGYEMRRDIGQIEAALYDMVYLGRTPAGCEFKENLFRTRILPLMKGLAPAGYYFGIDSEDTGLLGYWKLPGPGADPGTHESLVAADDSQTVPAGSPTAG